MAGDIIEGAYEKMVSRPRVGETLRLQIQDILFPDRRFSLEQENKQNRTSFIIRNKFRKASEIGYLALCG